MLDPIKISLILFMTSVLCSAGNRTRSEFMALKNNFFKTKAGRLISFDTDSGNLKIDLELHIPFMEVPVHKSVHFAKNVIARINLPSLILTGVIIFTSAVFLPALFTFVTRKFQILQPQPSFYRSEDTSFRDINLDATPLWDFGALVDSVLLENDIDASSCAKRTICALISKSKVHTLNGHASSLDKIIDGIVTNQWILDKVYGTPVYAAIKTGLNDVNCNEEYKSCKVPPQMFTTLIRQTTNFLAN